MANQVALSIQGLEKSFGRVRVLRGLDLEVPMVPDSAVAVLGQNGAGKTTLLNVVTRLVPPDGGAIRVFDESVLARPAHRLVELGETRTIRLASMLSCATFRLPAMLAVQAAQVDAMSGGRLELGIGAGWVEPEHRAYGIPFPGPAERLERLVEQIEIVLGMWATTEGETFTYNGAHYVLTECPALPKPVQRPRPPLILGGKGPLRTPRIAARYADEFNVAFDTLANVGAQLARARAACERIGRDPASLLCSVAVTTTLGRTSGEAAARVATLGDDIARLKIGPGLAGTIEEARERIGTYAGMGVARLYLQMKDLEDLDQLDLVAEELLGST